MCYQRLLKLTQPPARALHATFMVAETDTYAVFGDGEWRDEAKKNVGARETAGETNVAVTVLSISADARRTSDTFASSAMLLR